MPAALGIVAVADLALDPLRGAINAYFDNWVAVALAAAPAAGPVRTERFDFDVLGRGSPG